MNKTLTNISHQDRDKPDFEKINKFNVVIASLKRQLSTSTNIDELTVLAGKIIDLEQQIVVEKTAGYKKLEKEKKETKNKVDKIRRELQRAEDDLQRIDNSLDLKVNGYKKTLQIKIDALNEEYTTLVEHVNQLST